MSDYRSELLSWREQRARNIAAEGGWLSLTGLVWLGEGQHSIGSDPDSAVVLPRDSPARAGTLRVRGGEVWLEAPPGGLLSYAGSPARRVRIDLEKGDSETVSAGSAGLRVIRRGGRLGVRTWDDRNPARLHFGGLRWFAPDESWRLTARFVPQPTPLSVVNILGDVREATSPGFAVFELGGREYRLLAESADPERYLFFNFKDASNGHQTYGAGRFLTTEGVRGGLVTLDFNRATNPYCAYTPYATCPLAPAQNRLLVAVAAGEQNFPHD